MANYPNAVPTLRAVENDPGVAYDPNQKNVVFAEDINNMAAEIKAIAAELGTTPKGSDADVAARLNDISERVASHRGDISSISARVTALENKGYTRRIATVNRGIAQNNAGPVGNNGVIIIKDGSGTSDFFCSIPSTTKKLLLTITLMAWADQEGWWNISYVRKTTTGEIHASEEQALLYKATPTTTFTFQFEIAGDVNTTGFKIRVRNASGANKIFVYRNAQMTVDEIG